MSMEANKEQPSAVKGAGNVFPATVCAINDEYTVVINRGRMHGLKIGQEFLIYGLSEKEIVDPETKENLGYLEMVRGRGSITHLQDRLATIKSDRVSKKTRVIRRGGGPFLLGTLGSSAEESETVDSLKPFEYPEVGDKARPIGS